MHALSLVLDVHDRNDYNSRLIKYLADNNMTHILLDYHIGFSAMLDDMTIIDGPEKTVAFIEKFVESCESTAKSQSRKSIKYSLNGGVLSIGVD